MRLDYLTSAVQGVNAMNDVGDFFLTPLRALCDGRTYHVIYDTGNFDQPCDNGKIDQIAVVAEHISIFANKAFALLAVATVIPVVLGIVCKILAAFGGAFDEYEKAERVMNGYGRGTELRQHWQPVGKGYSVDPKGIALVPAPLKLVSLDAPATVKSYPLTKFLTVWDQVGCNRSDYFVKRGQLERWIQNEIPFTHKYTHIAQAQIPAAKKQLESELRGILQAFETEAGREVREWAILKLIEAAGVCSPTWVEETHEVYLDLLAGSFNDKVLRIVQKFKENVLKYIVQHVKRQQWHSVNPFRHQHGKQLGLVMENLEMDTAYQRHAHVLSVDEFLDEYQIDRLICFVETELNHAKRGAQIIDCLVEILAGTIPGDHTERSAYVREHFFKPHPNPETIPYYRSPDVDDEMRKTLELDARTELNVDGSTVILHHLGVIRQGGKHPRAVDLVRPVAVHENFLQKAYNRVFQPDPQPQPVFQMRREDPCGIQ